VWKEESHETPVSAGSGELTYTNGSVVIHISFPGSWKWKLGCEAMQMLDGPYSGTEFPYANVIR
jgi:hypothetical protein